MKWILGGVAAPKGFKAAGIHCGIKKIRKDLGMIVSDVPGVAAGTFTTNQIKAASVHLNMQTMKSGIGQAILVNSGNANACNGKPGLDDAKLTVKETAGVLKINPKSVYVFSTGVIGVRLPMKKLISGIHKISRELSGEGSPDAAQSIMTTDRVPKEVAVEFTIGGKTCRIGGITKGAGMISPNMTSSGKHATMLCFITTDAAIKQNVLQSILSGAVDNSFNNITVDNDQSTNDSVFMIANGLAGNKLITPRSKKDLQVFQKAVREVCIRLAKLIAKDGEGATKFIEIVVNGARTEKDAKKIGLAIANSPLVKTAIFGTDVNWGRILCAVGYAGIPLNPDKVDLVLGGKKESQKTFRKILLVKNSMAARYSEKKAKDILSNPDILLQVDLHLGKSSATVWTCDLSIDYIKINASYRS